MLDWRAVLTHSRTMTADAQRSAGPARLRRAALAATCAPIAGLVFMAQGAQAQDGAAAGAETHRELVDTYCVECHNFEDWAGGVALDILNLDHVGADPEVWEAAIGKLRGRLMPPAGQPQPEQAEVDAIVAYLEQSVDAAAEDRPVGHVPIQRLNRTEFATAVRDLIGVEMEPEQILPTEIEVEGFDNIANALGVSPSFLEQYMSASRRAARMAVGEPVPKLASTYYRSDGGSQRSPAGNQTTHRDGYPLGTRGGMDFTHTFPADGEYRFNILDLDHGLYPRGMQTAATLVILVDGEEVIRKEIGGPEDLALADRDGPEGRAAIIEKVTGMPAHIEAGTHRVIATFIERSRAASNDLTGGGDLQTMPRIQDGMEVEGPFESDGLSMSESREKIFICYPEAASEEAACARDIARNLATRAFRRPVTDADMDWLMPFYEIGRAEEGGFDAGVRELVVAILSSPDFLYRAILTPQETAQARPLNDLELASRLSFFLWSQVPDDELIALADQGRLSEPEVMQAQVARMLEDPRAKSLVENFALAWLNLDELDQVEPQDPFFNDAMRANFETEIRLFIESVLLEDRPVHALLDADWTYLNEGLAEQYDVEGVLGPQFRRVTLENENRWGLLGKGAMLLRTSYGDRTSPVLRGAWVLDRIVGTPPAPPPPNVETDLSVHEGDPPSTVRERLEQHRADPSCNGCHGLIDPPGLALENFDVTGRWREVDGQSNLPIDASTVLTSGATLDGPSDLREHLLRRPDQFATTVTRRAMMYALNREIEYFDMPEVREIVSDAEENGYTFAAIVNGIVNSDAFRHQGAGEAHTEEASLESDAPQTP